MNALRETLKALVRWIAIVLVSPLIVSYWLQAALMGSSRSLEDHTECLGVVPGVTGRYLRWAFLACVLEECHPSCFIGFGTLFSQPGARIGPRVYIGPRCHIGLATLQADVLLGAGVHVLSGARTHGIDDSAAKPIRDQEGRRTRVTVGVGVWVGSNAVLMSDVGEHSVVGAGAVVTKALPAQVVAAGVPARVIRSRVEEDRSTQEMQT